MKKLLLTILSILLLSSYAQGAPWSTSSGSGSGVETSSNCNQAAYFAIGTICQDTDDGKLYKGTGAAVVEITAGAASSFLGATAKAADADKLDNHDSTYFQVDLGLVAGTMTDGKYCTYTASGTVLNCNSDAGSLTSGKVCKTITNPSDSDNVLFDIATARTITKISGICVGGTSAVITLQDAGADGSGSTSIDDAITMDTDGANGGTISYAVHDGDIIKLDVGTVTGVVTQLMVCYE